jgi:hypothetical protein
MNDRRRGFVVLALASLQIVVPAFMLTANEKPSRFGWHMYSYPTTDVRVVVTFRDGIETQYGRDAWQLDRREIHLSPSILEAICRELPSAKEITSLDGEREATCR